MKPLRLPVRRVVELVLRCGDIDSRYVEAAVMQNGAKAHRKIQKAMGENYRREVPLRLETEMDGTPVVLHGRADGVIIDENGGVTIDEIKTTTLPLDRIYEQRELHIGQAKCYAHMLLQTLERPPESVTVQLTYCQLDTEELRRHRWEFTSGELEAFFLDLMRKYGVWLTFERSWKETRDISIKAVAFPFESYRKGQRELAVAAYRAIERGNRLYVQAPTGIGKTISALFPAIKAVGEGLAEKLFYLTAKTVTRAVAEDAVRMMSDKGLRFKSLTLRAKDKICFQQEPACNPNQCGYASGHYDRVNDALLDILKHNDIITPSVVEEYARKHRVCPFETALDVSLWADLVVCDYNHVFDPEVYLRRFFNDSGGDYVFLIDEAHNLADRVRGMYTTSLRKSDFYRLKKELKDKTQAAANLRGAMGKVNKHLLEARKACGEKTSVVKEEPDAVLAELVTLFTAACGEWLAAERQGAHPLHAEMLELYFEALKFAGISGIYDERYATITEIYGSDVVATLFCLDPSAVIGEKLKLAKAGVLFSATLTPLPYYRDILGGTGGDRMLALPSPFDKSRLLLAAHHGISTKYNDRPGSIRPVSDAIYRAVSKKSGNYIAYFPSHEYMRQVHEAFAAMYPEVKTALQQSAMDEGERARFLAMFSADNPGTLVGFCVMGGIFSEGIDLSGERLIGTVIVGAGLPKISLRQDLIRDYFDRVNGAGYDYAYVYPGMNKVLQAAGRVIRTETDYGVALLIDSRFHTPKYRGLYPEHWSDMHMVKSAQELERLIGAFPFFAR